MDSKSLEHLKERRNSLNRCFMRRKPPENGDSHARILDDYFIDRFSVSHAGFKLDLISNPYAIIATGAYGRKEVFPLPEVRVLFIFKDSIPHGAVELIRDIVYPLWDLGYTVHHSTKTLKDAVAGASADYGTLLSLLDSRFICGVSPLYSRLMTAVREKIVARKKKEILSFIWERDHIRHKKTDGPEYILEPDLFSSPGGLSDIGSMLSALRTVYDLGGLTDLDKAGIFSVHDRERLLACRDFIQNTLVFIQLSGTGDKGRLTLDLQMAAARFFNYKSKGPDTATDLFLSDLETWRSTISVLRRRLFSNLLPDKALGGAQDRDMRTDVKWVVISKGFVKITSLSKLRKHPELMLAVLSQGEENRMPVSPETLGMIAGFREFVPDGFFEDSRNTKVFEQLLLDSEAFGRTLHILGETGLLFAFVPELKSIENRKVFTHQPTYALLTHVFLALSHLKDMFARGKARTADDRLAGLWAALLHGLVEEHLRTGKTPDVSRTVLIRFGKNQGFVNRVQNLIRLNTAMQGVLHGEDLQDERVFTGMASVLGTPVELDLLYRLCLADLRSRASLCFSDFKETDLKQGVMTLSQLKQWTPPSDLRDAGRDPLRPKAWETRNASDLPSVHIHKADMMRQVILGFPLGMEMVFPALRALAFSGIDFYDLRVFPPEHGFQDLVIRTKAPRDTMFEEKKWAGFERYLKDLIAGEARDSADGTRRVKCLKESGSEADVAVTLRYENSKTVIIMHRPRPFDRLEALISGLTGQGIVPYYIKKSCSERDFCLAIHGDNAGRVDEEKVREEIYGIV